MKKKGKCIKCGKALMNKTSLGYHYSCFIKVLKSNKEDIEGTGLEIVDSTGARIPFSKVTGARKGGVGRDDLEVLVG